MVVTRGSVAQIGWDSLRDSKVFVRSHDQTHRPTYRTTNWRIYNAALNQRGSLDSEATPPKTVMIDMTYLKAHRTASSLGLKKGGNDRRGRLIG